MIKIDELRFQSYHSLILTYPEAQSVILYSTGNVLDYQKIIEWYYNGSDGKNIKNLSSEAQGKKYKYLRLLFI